MSLPILPILPSMRSSLTCGLFSISCAIFSEDGALVANAPHGQSFFRDSLRGPYWSDISAFIVPVHLGSMGYAVKYQADLLKGKMRPGDVIVSNHPEGPSDMTSSSGSRLTDEFLLHSRRNSPAGHHRHLPRYLRAPASVCRPLLTLPNFPVWDGEPGSEEIAFFACARGHHIEYVDTHSFTCQEEADRPLALQYRRTGRKLDVAGYHRALAGGCPHSF